MTKLSTGDPSTLGSYFKLCTAFGLRKAAKFFEDKIAETSADDEVIQDERQMMHLIGQIEYGE